MVYEPQTIRVLGFCLQARRDVSTAKLIASSCDGNEYSGLQYLLWKNSVLARLPSQKLACIYYTSNGIITAN